MRVTFSTPFSHGVSTWPGLSASRRASPFVVLVQLHNSSWWVREKRLNHNVRLSTIFSTYAIYGTLLILLDPRFRPWILENILQKRNSLLRIPRVLKESPRTEILYRVGYCYEVFLAGKRCPLISLNFRWIFNGWLRTENLMEEKRSLDIPENLPSVYICQNKPLAWKVLSHKPLCLGCSLTFT